MKCRICNKEKELIKGICQDCLESRNKTFDLDNIPKIIYLLNCPKDGIYLGNSSTNNCPVCRKSFKFKCEKCGNYKSSPNKICGSCGFNPIIYTCKICGKILKENESFCIECIESTNKTFNLDNIPKIIYLLHCPKDGIYLAKHNRNSCPICHKSYQFKCKKCGSSISSNLSRCSKCGYREEFDFNYKCKQCGFKLNSPGSKCPNCSYNAILYYNYECEKCGYKLSNSNQRCENCGYCKLDDIIYKCKQCNNTLNNINQRCEKCGYCTSDDADCRCKKCGSRIPSNLSICSNCNYNPHIDMNYNCKQCGYPISNSNQRCENCGYCKSDNVIFKCKKCGSSISSNFSICDNCNYNPNIDNNYRCHKCGNKLPFSNSRCENCGYCRSDDSDCRCKKCGSRIPSNLSVCDNCHYNPSVDFTYYCDNCKSNQKRKNNKCAKCGHKLKTLEKSLNNLLSIPNFIIKDSIKYYKNIEIHELIHKLDNGEIEIPYGFEKRFGNWCYQNIDILTDEKILTQNSNFIQRDDLFVYDHRISNYVNWNELKLDYLKNITLQNWLENSGILNKYPNEKIIPTFITNINENSNTKRFMEGLGIFQQFLVDEEIEWCAYGKFAKDNESYIPLVSGQSASLLINNSGHDLSFSHNIEDGPARLYIKEHNIDWFKDEILIIPTKSREESLIVESDLSNFNFPFNS